MQGSKEEENNGFGVVLFEPEQWGEDCQLGNTGGSCTPANQMTLEGEIEQLQEPFRNECLFKDISKRKGIIDTHMGSMAQCRGKLGDKLREAGAISSLMSLLHILIIDFIVPSDLPIRVNEEIFDLVIASLGALRDLACGSAMNRLCIGSFSVIKNHSRSNIGIRSGIDLITFFIKRYHHLSWNDIICLEELNNMKANDKDRSQQTARGKLELKVLTSTTGVIRNISHSNRTNCEALHHSGVTEFFIWRLRSEANLSTNDETCGSQSAPFSRLPHPSKPWREASFRIASSLINMAEKCNDCASRCANDDDLIYTLLESWGGKAVYEKHTCANKFPVLHLGLIAVLSQRLNVPDRSGEKELEKLIQNLFVREDSRKKAAQARELNRKQKNKH
eukprot:CAMPEP_0203680302 /NCGR_PEP_ID=MMETSP0090-20130426/38727_1 /ASSEMBLY_ACC=CAM_ASM_001088 /TAXON_ID=426623 /ORGANISM="Chaetoceros affinis, Strain CCMP159" /LENGTH=390 /DNA_ID=CAMNT_0050548313 /DNA_START=43 /DNA_END=1215 /DNA_ORIENTATION=-